MDHAGVSHDVVGAVRWMTFVVEGGRTPPYIHVLYTTQNLSKVEKLTRS